MPASEFEPVLPLDLRADLEAHGPKYVEAFRRVLASGQFILGSEVRAFEAEMARYLDVDHALGVNSGTDALIIALRSLGIGVGDEVITTPFTFFATAEAISSVGATPVFVDIDPETLNLDPGRVDEALGPSTGAILPVHLFGRPADMERIATIAAERDLPILEDAAQALGASCDGQKAGTIGAAGAFSFYPTKTLGALGDGGLVATNDPDVANRVRMLRNHGERRRYENEMLGYNSRLDEIQAAILREKLPRLDRENQDRRRVAEAYDELLGGVEGLKTPPLEAGTSHVFHQYTVRISRGLRDQVRNILDRVGIATRIYYPIPVHRLPVYNGAPSCPEAELAATEVLSLPIWPTMTDSQIERVSASLIEALQESR